jgi:alpha-tubulin suppressor-like RCC1 family protein
MPIQPGRTALTRALLVTVSILTAGACERGTEPSPGPADSPDLAVTAVAVSWRQIAAGWQHTCAITTANVAYCWGANGGALGDGTTISRLRPVKVLGGLKFMEIRAGEGHTCGVTTDSLAYCWGSGESGQLGNGTAVTQLTPKLVAGGRKWRQVSPGAFYTCGVTTASVAYCWGNNDWGQVGVSGVTASTVPVRIAGDLKWRRVVTAYSHTCGTTTGNRGYCWGFTWSKTPRAVPGTVAFRQVLPGSGYIINGSSGPFVDDIYACGISTTDRLYCRFAAANPPTTPIAPTRAWLYVNPGGYHTCGLTYAGGAFCWGSNQEGALGTGGAPAGTSTPTQVAGGRTYRGLSASVIGFYTCGVTTDNRAFCWGDNQSGQLGDGTQYTDRFTPVAVLNPL